MSNLTWTSKPVMDVSTYHAESDGWKYTVDQPRKGRWVLRGWGPGCKFLYRNGYTTMKAAKSAAEDHHTGKAAERAGAGLAQVAPALAKMAPVVSEAAASMARAVQMVQAARDRVQFRKDTCGCKTPLHTMRCGVGGRAVVIQKLDVR